MALVIKGEMPKACNWFDENGKQHFCKVNAFCDCEVFTRGEKPSDCPILAEIPDKHGRIVDLDDVLDWLVNKKRTFSMKTSAIVIKALKSAPTILEASATTSSRNRTCPHYQGVCGLDEEILCYCSSSYETCDTYKEANE